MKSARALAIVTMTVATLARGPLGEPLALASPTIGDIKITSQVDKSSVTFSRKSGGGGSQAGNPYLKITLKEVIVTRDASGLPTGKRGFKPVVVTMTGPDAPVCSLLYPVVALARGGAGAVAALQTQGYNCSVMDKGSQDCQSVASAQTCTDLANQLSENIDAALALGDGTERGAFQAGLRALGFTTCQTATTTTTTTSSTTSTTLCPAGQTRCAGMCVNTATDPNNCGTCGFVCPVNTPVCIGSVCTIP
jgi:hypothetical protein